MRFGELRYNRNLRQVYYITTPSPLSSGRLYESIICFPVDRRKEYIFEEKQQFNTTAQSELPYADEQNGVLRWYGFACYQLQCIGAS